MHEQITSIALNAPARERGSFVRVTRAPGDISLPTKTACARVSPERVTQLAGIGAERGVLIPMPAVKRIQRSGEE